MAFPLDQGLQLDSLWSSGDLYFENSHEDHRVSRQLVLHKIAMEISVWQRCRSLQLALKADQLLRRREAFFLSLQLLDMSHKRWSPPQRLEFGDIHSLAAAAFATSELLPETGLDLCNQCALYPACSWLLQPALTDLGPQRLSGWAKRDWLRGGVCNFTPPCLGLCSYSRSTIRTGTRRDTRTALAHSSFSAPKNSQQRRCDSQTTCV